MVPEHLTTDRLDALLRYLWRIDEAPDLNELFRLTRFE